jgi:hypothetical protein
MILEFILLIAIILISWGALKIVKILTNKIKNDIEDY